MVDVEHHGGVVLLGHAAVRAGRTRSPFLFEAAGIQMGHALVQNRFAIWTELSGKRPVHVSAISGEHPVRHLLLVRRIVDHETLRPSVYLLDDASISDYRGVNLSGINHLLHPFLSRFGNRSYWIAQISSSR